VNECNNIIFIIRYFARSKNRFAGGNTCQ